MSNYTIEISGNQPYYIQVENSESPINLEIIKENDNVVEISSANTFITFDLPSGYPIEATSGYLPYTRVSDLATYIQSFIPQQSAISINGGTP
jgi:hypothetical protein